MISKQHILLNNLVCIRIFTKVKEERFEETSAFLVDLPELRVVVPDQSISVSNSSSHHVSIRDVLIIRHV